MKEKIQKLFDSDGRENLFVRLFSAWSVMSIINFLTVSDEVTSLEFVKNTNLCMSLVYFFFSYILITLLSIKFPKIDIDGFTFAGSTLTYLAFSAFLNSDQYYCLALLFPAALSCVYTVRRFYRKKNVLEPSGKFTLILSCTVGVLVTAYIALIGVARYLTFSTPNFDFGIFSQMFYYLKEELVPLTTCEREQLLSHFAVHLSPVYYLLLPVYFIFPSPVTLQVSQAIILGSSLIPLYLLARHFKLSNKATLLLVISAAFYPALMGGTMYDFHENCFLLPFILWLLYFAEKNKSVPMYIFMLLTFSIKEDAPIYVAFIALYFILSGRKKLHGAVMFLSSVLYFTLAVSYLKTYGTGAMTGRFDNFITDPDAGLIDMIFTIFKDPAYFISQCLTEEKLLFIFFMLLPLGFMPILSKKWSQFVLIGPLILINLMSNYGYQHSIYFQYVYGTMAVLFYLTALNLKDLPHSIRKFTSPVAMVCSVIIFIFAFSPKITYLQRLDENREENYKIRTALDTIDEDKSVLSTTFFIPYLSQRKEIYEIEYCVKDTDVIVIDLRNQSADACREKIDFEKYELVLEENNLLEIYEKID